MLDKPSSDFKDYIDEILRKVGRNMRLRAAPADPVPGRRRIVTGIVFGMQVNAGRTDVGVAQVVADHLGVISVPVQIAAV